LAYRPTNRPPTPKYTTVDSAIASVSLFRPPHAHTRAASQTQMLKIPEGKIALLGMQCSKGILFRIHFNVKKVKNTEE
jgi:hypothetical protein